MQCHIRKELRANLFLQRGTAACIEWKVRTVLDDDELLFQASGLRSHLRRNAQAAESSPGVRSSRAPQNRGVGKLLSNNCNIFLP